MKVQGSAAGCNNITRMPRDILTNSQIITNMKAVVEAKMTLVDKKAKVSSGCGRTKYLGIDMAFIYIRGKRMLTMSEIARKLYPHWPRATLYDRVKQMSLRKHTCTPREIEKVFSVNGVVKQGIHCTLISKEDLDIFRSVYKVGPPTTGIKEKRLSGNEATLQAGKRRQNSPSRVRPKQNNHEINNRKALCAAQTKARSNVLDLNKPTQRDKRGTRVRSGQALGRKRHVSLAINKHEVNKTTHSNGVSSGQSQSSPSNELIAIRKRKHSASKGIEKATPKRHHGATKIQRKERVTCSPPSDCTSLDSGISSLTLHVPEKGSKISKSGPKSTKQKIKSGPKFKDSKRDGLAKLKDGKLKNHKSGLKRKGGKMKGSKRNEKGTGFKKTKVSQCSKGGLDTITKEFITKMDLKNMNDNDLINSLSSSPFSTHDSTPHTEDPSGYHIKLMPVKPVWRVNSSFKFISNFLLTPSLVVRDGELKPACSMVCNPGQRPPSAHPIWKWKIGEPVIGNKTEISYRIKKVKCVDSQIK